jgi:outer membrane receptor protein involved in Fe transport
MKIVTSSWSSLLLAALVPAISLSAQTTPAQTEPASEDVIVLPSFSVRGVADGSYMATESTSGTRTAAQIINLPYSVQVLPEEFVRDFQLYDLDDQALFVGGMAPGDPSQGGGGGTRLRGFFVPYFRNGFYRRQAPDSSSIDRVEVVKGPQSAVYGRVSPGGVINYISKKPQTTFKSGLSYVLGTYDYQRVDGYVTGPLVDKKLFYRVDAAYYDFERPTDFWFNRTTNASGALTWKVTPNTQLTLEYEYTKRIMNDTQAFTRWIDSAGITQATVYDIPDRVTAERLIATNVNGAFRETSRLNDSTYLNLEHKFSNDLSLRANVGYSTRAFERHTPSTPTTWDTRVNLAANAAFLAAVEWVDETRGVWNASRTMSHQTIDDKQVGSQIDLTKVWSGSKVKQRTLLTVDLFDDYTEQGTWALSGTALDNELRALGLTTTQQLNAWKRPDPFAPEVSGLLPNPAFNPALWSATDASTFEIDRFYYGGLLNHTAEMLDGRLMLTGSLRQDWAEYERKQPLSANPSLRNAEGEADELTYSAGFNYHIIPRALVAYVSYGSAFDPAPQVDPNTGEFMGNKTAKGTEAGLKGIVLNNRLSYTLSGYQVTQENEVTSNPGNPGGTDPSLPSLIPGAGTKGKGMSLDVSGKITENLTLLGNVAYTDIWIYKHATTPSLIGTKPTGGQNAPERTAGFAVRYNFSQGALKGLRLGATYQYSDRYIRFYGTGPTNMDFYLPGRSEFGGVVSYTHRPTKKITATYSINVLNAFDEKEISVAAYSPFGRQVRFSTSIRF